MESGVVLSSLSSKNSVSLFPEPFTEAEVTVMLGALLRTIDIPFKKSEEVPKTILIDYFGTQKSMKTSVTGKIEQVFRRNKFKVYCPPETAEHEGIRSMASNIPIVEQAKHLNGVEYQDIYLSRHPSIQFAQTSRGPIDMLYWYERGLTKGIYNEAHVEAMRVRIYELLRQDLIDAFLFFTCSVETAMRREHEGALTQKRGSKMNEKEVGETIDLYNKVLTGVEENIPGLPIHHVDTSDMDLRQAGQEVLRFILPTICGRFGVRLGGFVPFAPSLVRRYAKKSAYFEEQIKFRGHPSAQRIQECGWSLTCSGFEQEDIYLGDKDSDFHDPAGEGLRLRREGDVFKFMYKGNQKDRILSHRDPCSFEINPDEAERILASYKTVAVLRKSRHCLEKSNPTEEGGLFTLHLDRIEGLGDFTEIRARGSADRTHTKELLQLADELGLSIGSMVEGNYLSVALSKK